MKIYLAGGELRKHWIHEEMQVYLAGSYPYKPNGLYDETMRKYRPYVLESYAYVEKEGTDCSERLLPYYGDYMLDSGAFSFMQGAKAVDWDAYIDRYAAYIKRNNVEKFFELDIDCIVGYEEVRRLRRDLERKTGRQCIPVWHKSRGRDEFAKMAHGYRYVALGGLVDNGGAEYGRQYWPAFDWFIKTAHDAGAKIHALGFTSIEGIKKYHFDSVDSSSWTAGNRFGFLYKFTGNNIAHIKKPGSRIVDARAAALHNFVEWVKFQQYADRNL